MKTKIQREQMDKKLKSLKNSVWPRPSQGWIKTLRELLGMNQRHLAERLGISTPSLHALEKAEKSGSITLKKLSQVAEAMGCELRFALVPRTSLEEYVDEQAEKKAREVLERTAQHMYLEDQATDTDYKMRRVEELKQQFIRDSDKRIWEGESEDE